MLDTKGFVQDETGAWWKQATKQRHKGVEHECERCGKRFITYATHRKQQRFCSPECIHEARQRRKQFNCTRCGAVVERRAARDKRTTSDNVFCSRQCHYAWQREETDRIQKSSPPCPTCGKLFEQRSRYPSQRKTYCSRECAVRDPNGSQMLGHAKTRRENSYRWKGGAVIRRGYCLRFVPEHPDCQGNTRQYVLEHRLVMEEHLGRYLTKQERVHHKNGDTLDNRIENLELWEMGHPAGQRATEKPHCPTCTCFRE
jgi:hypothetical protein